MKNLKYILLLLFAMALSESCTRDNYLDIQPKGTDIPTTVEDFRLMLDNVSSIFSGELSQGFSIKHHMTLQLNDNHALFDEALGSGITLSMVRAYMFEAQFYSPLEDDLDWNQYYNQIYLSNIILDGLSKAKNGTPQEIAALAAEAKVHRAYAYFNLVNIYGIHYNASSAATDLGVPIREGIALDDVSLARASVQEVYDYALNDITTSIADLEDTQPTNYIFRPSKSAAYGVLAKIYLYQGKYPEALDAANDALALSNTLRDINNNEVGFDRVRINPLVTEDEEIIWLKNHISSVRIYPSDELVFLYDFEDLRFQKFGSLFEALGVFKFFYAAGALNENLSDGITTPDLYLIRAECNARLNNIQAANDDLNALREKRYPTGLYTPVNITDPSLLLQFVKDERRREIAISFDRTFDIKRYNLFDNDNISLTHTLEGKTATLEANSKNWAFPIATKILQRNPELKQNPRD